MDVAMASPFGTTVTDVVPLGPRFLSTYTQLGFYQVILSGEFGKSP